ncbi:DUF1641 domain-containing protein [Gordonia rhizosphera]|uniref:DUF1641 domain-containing protein n=1 Tax=Gordonia rhizosphera NBRC 16068 TaxID=1108045 RepID=K6VX72_9ACTN|nr:DUF1641 domain-containing protein [Gordonia rhizosphera]GAB91520.1 hypothetical protein GORHZ_135_00700 [Gordonia rhizosphera NBRC 16068]
MTTVVSLVNDDADAAEQRRKALADRMAEPEVADALLSLLDHADLLAVLVEGLDGLLQRGDDLSNTLVDALTELRATVEADDSPFAAVDLTEIGRTLRTAMELAADVTPALGTLKDSGVFSPDTVGAVGRLGGALASADVAYRAGRTPTTMRGVLGGLRDKQVRAGLGYLVGVAKALGASSSQPPPGLNSDAGRSHSPQASEGVR